MFQPLADMTPGLPGAPVRTPVKTAGAAAGPSLWPAIIGRVLTRQLWVELYGLPGYSLTLKGPKVAAFAASPRDMRPHEPTLGKLLLGGRLTLAGASLEAPPHADPFNRACPSKAFAVELHSFAWLPSLMLNGERGVREALRLVLHWDAGFRRWSPFAWDARILARRVINLSVAARRLGAVAADGDRAALADSLGRQARQLLRPPGGVATKADRYIAAALAGCVLAGSAGQSLRRRALARLPGALAATVGPDGGHASRSPEAALELRLDLLTLEDALNQISEPAPPAVHEASGRLAEALARMTLPDGRLAAFQGGGPAGAPRVAAALSDLEKAPESGPGEVNGYRRIASPLLTVMADAASPAKGGWGEAACAQPLALEIVCGRDRLISSAAWTPRALERQALRLTPGASTLTLGDGSLGEPLGGWRAELLGPRLFGADYHVNAEHREGEGAVWLELEHDGWVKPYGLLHQRRLYLDQRLDELRAEERLHPAPGHGRGESQQVRVIAAPYAVRFHLEPGVQASLARDRRSILLRGHSGRGWWFRTDGPDVAIEPSVHVEDGLTRRATQIVVRGSARTDAETRIRWKLSPAGGAGDPV
ncbi:heparinase II/III family protein [Brevundimonas balnearis]|uniref:Heparinase II/III family protein n=1 Tax=Brevundimonas balnearis TaxID=1572858 RepID=A0ABV6R3D6_9CAUL